MSSSLCDVTSFNMGGYGSNTTYLSNLVSVTNRSACAGNIQLVLKIEARAWVYYKPIVQRDGVNIWEHNRWEGTADGDVTFTATITVPANTTWEIKVGAIHQHNGDYNYRGNNINKFIGIENCATAELNIVPSASRNMTGWDGKPIMHVGVDNLLTMIRWRTLPSGVVKGKTLVSDLVWNGGNSIGRMVGGTFAAAAGDDGDNFIVPGDRLYFRAQEYGGGNGMFFNFTNSDGYQIGIDRTSNWSYVRSSSKTAPGHDTNTYLPIPANAITVGGHMTPASGIPNAPTWDTATNMGFDNYASILGNPVWFLYVVPPYREWAGYANRDYTGDVVIDCPGNGTWTVPSNVDRIRVVAAGGGGGGAGGYYNGGSGGGGGGAGGVVAVDEIPVTAGDVYNIKVGNGGQGGKGTTNRYGAGGTGGETLFYKQGSASDSLLRATGGPGATGSGAASNGEAFAGVNAPTTGVTIKSGRPGNGGRYDNRVSYGGDGGDSAYYETVGLKTREHPLAAQRWAITLGMRDPKGTCGDKGGYFGLGGRHGHSTSSCNYAGGEISLTTQQGIYGGGGGGANGQAGDGGGGVITIETFVKPTPPPVYNPPPPPPPAVANIDTSKFATRGAIHMAQLSCMGGSRTFRFPSNFQSYITKRGFTADSGLQGYMGWKYGYSLPTTRNVVWYDPTSRFKNQTLFRGPEFTGAPLFPFMNVNGHMHPHTGMLNVLRWQAPVDGAVRFLGHLFTVNHGGGNGTIYWLGKMKADGGPANASNRTATLASFHLKGGTSPQYVIPTINTTHSGDNRPWDWFNVTQNVKKGDTFYLVLGPNSDPSYDSTFVALNIYYENWTAIPHKNACYSLREMLEDQARYQTVLPRYAERYDGHGQTNNIGRKFSDSDNSPGRGCRMSDFIDSTWIPSLINSGFQWDTAQYDNVGTGALRVNMNFAMNGKMWWGEGQNGNVISSQFRVKNMTPPETLTFVESVERDWQASNTGATATTGGLGSTFTGLVGGRYKAEYEIKWKTPQSTDKNSRGQGNPDFYTFNSNNNNLLAPVNLWIDTNLMQNYGYGKGVYSGETNFNRLGQ